MLTRGVFYLAAFIVASVAIVGYAVFNQLSFPVVCVMMIVFTCFLGFASDDLHDEERHNSRSQMPAALTNHLQTSSPDVAGSVYNSNDSNNSNCIRAHSDVELTAFTVSSGTLSGRTSARDHTNRVVRSVCTVPFQTELLRTPHGGTNRVALNDSVQTPTQTLTSPSRSGCSRSQQRLLPQFQRITTGLALSFDLDLKHCGNF